jgi:hypothetical protein
MIRNIKTILPVLAITFAMITALPDAVFAESNNYDGSCYYTGSKIVSSFSSAQIAKAVENLQPGDDVTFTVTYENRSKDDTDWYMENTVVRTLENTDKSRKNAYVSGTDNAENGGYTYELVQYSSSGAKKVLFSNSRVGGDNGTVAKLNGKSGNMTGLEPATNALDEWFYIDTVASHESGKVVLHVAFDGETEVNDYMDTSGELNMRFAVEIPEKGKKPVKTGDQSNLLMWTAICLSGGILLFILAFVSRRRERRTETSGDGYRGRRYKE